MRRVVSFFIFSAVLVMFSLLLSGQASASSAFDRYFRGSHLYFELSEDSITDTNKFEAELELRYRGDNVRAFIRGSNDRPFPYQQDPFEITKRGLNFELNDDWQVSLGDYSLVFGRGISLNAIENRPIDHDAQLDGLLVEGDVDFVDLIGFWGYHKSDHMETYLSGVNTNETGPADELKGGRIEFEFDDFDFGISRIDADMTRWDQDLSVVVTEIDADWRIGDFRLYHESAWFDRDEPEDSEESMDGRASLTELLYAQPGMSISGAWVRYDDAQFDYGTAVSLRRSDVDSSDAHPNDEKGYRIDTRFIPASWSGHSLRALYTNLNGIENKDQPFRNLFIEWSTPSTSDWSATLSYDRVTGLMYYYGALEGTDMNYRLSVDGPCPLGGSMHLFARFRELSNDFEDDDEIELGLDWGVSSDFTIGFFRETSTREMEPPPPGMMVIPGESPGQWNSALIRYTPDPWTEMELLLGSRRGGYQCSGGVCAQVPPFKGVRFSYYRLF